MSRSRPRAVVVVTGSELVRGERTDLNGPFLARSLLALGLEPARINIVGDDPDELAAAVREAVATAELVVVSGGLGPTHDDRTVEVVARVAELELEVRPELEAEIEAFSRIVAERMKRAYTDFAGGVRKQATLPAGAISLGLAGTAPGLVVEAAGTPVVVLPGPLAELQRLWPNALATAPVRRVLAGGRCASSARASRWWRRRSPRRAATGTEWRRRSARAISRSSSRSWPSRPPRSAPSS